MSFNIRFCFIEPIQGHWKQNAYYFHQTEDIIPHEYANLSLLVRRIIFKFAVTILLILLIKKIHETTAPIPYMQPGLPPYCSR